MGVHVCHACRHDVHPFCSKASGLELWNSDIDVVVLGVMQPDRQQRR